MSTPKRIKQMRLEAHQQQKKERELRKLFFAPTSKKREFVPYEKPKSTVFARETPYYPSFSSAPTKTELLGNDTPKQEPMQYSGDYIIGIATMHKSNMVPVGREDNPKDYSTMRRN